MQPTLKYYGIKQSIYALTATSAANEAAWLGRYIVAAHLPDLAFLSINLFQGAGFGLATKAGAILATPVLSEVIENNTIISIASTIFGALGAYGASVAAAALGLTAAPISIPAAISLTVVSIAIAILFPADKSSAAAKDETKEKSDALEKEKAQLKKDQRQLAADLEQLRTYRAALAAKEKNLREEQESLVREKEALKAEKEHLQQDLELKQSKLAEDRKRLDQDHQDFERDKIEINAMVQSVKQKCVELKSKIDEEELKAQQEPQTVVSTIPPASSASPSQDRHPSPAEITLTLSQKLPLGPYEGSLGWVKAVCKAQGIHENHFPKKFTSGWEDGIALCALVSYYRPDLIDQKILKLLDPSKGSDNIKLGINAAAKAGCSDIMDAGDFGLERLSMQTYLSCVYKKFVEKM